MSPAPSSSNNRELIENFRKILGPFLQPERSGAAWPPDWAPAKYSPLPRLLDREELNLIESVGGYRARLYRVYLYTRFASRIRKAIFEARKLTLNNLNSTSLPFDKMLKRDRELAICLFLIYAAVPIAALKLGDASHMLESAANHLGEILAIRAEVLPIRSV
jgi:hypothetical protein